MARKIVIVGCLLAAAGAGAIGIYYQSHRDSPYVLGCEEYLKDGLAAPATYKRVSVSEHVRPISHAELRALGGNPTSFRGAPPFQYELHEIGISFDADNGMGVPIRSGDACIFSNTRDSEVSEPLLRMKVDTAEMQRMYRGLIESGTLDNSNGHFNTNPKYPCCL